MPQEGLCVEIDIWASQHPLVLRQWEGDDGSCKEIALFQKTYIFKHYFPSRKALNRLKHGSPNTGQPLYTISF